MRLWYVTTAVHLWRFYFRFTDADPNGMSESSRLNWEACNRAIRKFNNKQVDLLKHYYMTGYGKYEDMIAVENYAGEHGIRQSEVWNIIKQANYEVIVERGLMERKDAEK